MAETRVALRFPGSAYKGMKPHQSSRSEHGAHCQPVWNSLDFGALPLSPSHSLSLSLSISLALYISL